MARNTSRGVFILAAALAVTPLWLSTAHADLTKGQQKCVNVLNVDFTRVDKATTRQVSQCLKNFAKGRPFNVANPAVDTIEECLFDDPVGKILRATGRTSADYTRFCTPPPGGTLSDPFPPFGATSDGFVNFYGNRISRFLVHETFGGFLDPGRLVTDAANRDGSRCQQKVWKAVGKCEQAHVKEYNKCAKLGLKGKNPPGLIQSANDLRDLCLGIGTAGQPDAKNKIAKRCTDPAKGLERTINRSCGGQNLTTLFEGNQATPAGAAAFLNDRIECQVCIHLNRADNLDRDCDLFDDGTDNNSCFEND